VRSRPFTRWLLLAAVLILGGAAGVTLVDLQRAASPSPDAAVLAGTGLEPVGRALERKLRPKLLDTATARLKRQLEEGRYRPMNPKAGGRVIVLMYHDAVPQRDKNSVWFDTTPAEFAADLAFLRSNGAHFITLDQLHHHLTLGTPLPNNPVALTFDDGYRGFYTYIYPVLKRERTPAAMFPHTDYVGTTNDRPKMTWDELRRLDREGLITIGSHTLSHPADLSKLPGEVQRRELLESKWVLERELGHPIAYVTYPNGKGDVVTWKIAREVGYSMGFMEEWQLAGDSPDMLSIGRYIQTQLRRAWRDLQGTEDARTGYLERPLKDSPVRLEYHGALALIRGGRAQSRLSPYREGVTDFIAQSGAVAGINGTFFADPYLKSLDNTIIGPVMAAPYNRYVPERNPYLLPRIVERPLVLWNAKRIAFMPFKLDMNRLETVHALMPDFTDAFVGGAWIVHKGKSAWPFKNPPSDHTDRRPRVFFGLADGEPVLGASLRNVSTAELAGMAAAAGVEEAVLLDSGYSTSLVYGKRLIAVGKAWEKVPSRPVPHAIVLLGQPEQVAGKSN